MPFTITTEARPVVRTIRDDWQTVAEGTVADTEAEECAAEEAAEIATTNTPEED